MLPGSSAKHYSSVSAVQKSILAYGNLPLSKEFLNLKIAEYAMVSEVSQIRFREIGVYQVL